MRKTLAKAMAGSAEMMAPNGAYRIPHRGHLHSHDRVQHKVRAFSIIDMNLPTDTNLLSLSHKPFDPLYPQRGMKPLQKHGTGR
jgi:hypothetical protein